METVDIAKIVVDGFAGIGPVLATVAAAGLTVVALKWGIPTAIGFFKKTAK